MSIESCWSLVYNDSLETLVLLAVKKYSSSSAGGGGTTGAETGKINSRLRAEAKGTKR